MKRLRDNLKKRGKVENYKEREKEVVKDRCTGEETDKMDLVGNEGEKSRMRDGCRGRPAEK